jgi:hypothetical protein
MLRFQVGRERRQYRFKKMIALIDGRTLLIVGSAALIAAALLAGLTVVMRARRDAARADKLVPVGEVSRDWQRTGRINAVADGWVMENEQDDIPSNFALRVEENRMVRDIGGGEVMEIRWRQSTKAEVREIVRRYHAGQNDSKSPLEVMEFQKQLHAGASSRTHADSQSELHHVGSDAVTLVPAPGSKALERRSRS